MIEVSETLKSYLQSNGRTFETKLVSGSNEYGNSENSRILSLKIESLLGGDNVGIGNTGCAKLEVTLFDSSGVKFQGNHFKVYIKAKDGTEVWTQLGEFKAEKPTVKDGAITFVGYDRMNETGGMYESELGSSTTVGKVWSEMCKHIAGAGFCVSLSSELAALTFSPDYLRGYTYRTAMGYLAAYLGCNAVVNNSGKFEMVPLLGATTADVISPYNCEVPETEETDYQLGYIICNRGDKEPLKAGDGTRGFSCVCPFMTDERLTEIANAYLYSSKKSSSVRYRVGKVSIPKGDFRIEVGDWLSYASGSQNFVFPIMKHTIEFDGGIMNVIEALGKTPEEESASVLSIEERVKNAVNDEMYSIAQKQTAVVRNFSKTINGALGLYETEIENADGSKQTYLHNKPNIEDSTYIATINAGGFAFSTGTGCWNSGNPTWTSGMTSAGNAVMNTINTYKIAADRIDVDNLAAFGATLAGFEISGSQKPKNGFWANSLSCVNNDENDYYAAFFRNSNTEGVGKIVFGIRKITQSSTPTSDDWDSAKAYYTFSVSRQGHLTATSADITGKITAKSGTIAGFEISDADTEPSNGFWKNSLSCVNSEDAESSNKKDYYAVFMRNAGAPQNVAFGIKKIASVKSVPTAYQWTNTDYTFSVSCRGHLYAVDAEIKGKITATSLTLVDGAKLAYSYISGAPDLTVYVKKNGAIALIGENPGNKTTGFKVSSAGLLKASNAVIYGTIYASSGKISGWNIGETYSGTNGIFNTCGDYEVGMKVSDSVTAAAFYVRNKSGDGSTPFYVRNDGKLVATSADISGKVTATSGSIGDWNIGETYSGANGIFNTCGNYEVGMKVSDNATSAAFYVRDKKNSKTPFYVTNEGILNATGAKISGTFEGKISATGVLGAEAILCSGSFTGVDMLLGGNLTFGSQTSIKFNTGGTTTKIGIRYTTINSTGCLAVGIDTENLRLYGKAVYLGSTSSAVTSDARLKTDVSAFTPQHEALFKALQPCSFKYAEGTSGRTHFGFIAQDVKSAIESAGLTTQQAAVYVEVASDRAGFNGTEYAIRYDEIIALNTYMIQNLLQEISRLKERMTTYESNV